ncbi:uncharacterized protein [Prorops nasuta]|uniref:uncharacterized protein n=1 Tax=Prorops nasuta TaxID=863751 RepID=UPI0034CEA6A8
MSSKINSESDKIVNDQNSINNSDTDERNYELPCNVTEHSCEDRKPTLREKLRKFCLENISQLNNKLITKLLHILKEEGLDVPECAETLLTTKKNVQHLQPIKSFSNAADEYRYYGIENALCNIITPEIYTETQISIIINVDDLPLYNASTTELWPILGQIFHKSYNCQPFVIALYCGNSKPASVEQFLFDFIEESNKLIENGLKIKNKLYSFKILAFVCDTPAREFLKCTKGYTGFFSCERCITEGETIDGKRIFPEINCDPRNKSSFEYKVQPEHHKDEFTSPLLKIINFDIIQGVLLDSMHLLFLGITKTILFKWIKPGC